MQKFVVQTFANLFSDSIWIWPRDLALYMNLPYRWKLNWLSLSLLGRKSLICAFPPPEHVFTFKHLRKTQISFIDVPGPQLHQQKRLNVFEAMEHVLNWFLWAFIRCFALYWYSGTNAHSGFFQPSDIMYILSYQVNISCFHCVSPAENSRTTVIYMQCLLP